VEEVIRPALARGADVVCDRYVDSSLAYQGIARGLGLQRVLELNLAAVGGLLPDQTFLMVIDADTAARRVGEVRDRIERGGASLWERVDEAYRELGRRYHDRIVAVDATRSPDVVAEEVYEALRGRA
jgi:dTMP kinase